MADEHVAAAGNAEQQPAARFFKLPDFWVSSPAAWFGVAESQFGLRDVRSQRDRFALVTAVLPESSARRVAHILAAPGVTCYDDLKAALLSAHQLTAFQKAEQLFSSEPLGDRRPSELLSEMLELVHPGEESTRLFALLFLRRLPAAIRLLLTEDDHTDVRALAEKADRCAASLHRSQQLSVAAAVFQPDSDPEAAECDFATIAAAGFNRGGARPKWKQQQQSRKAAGGQRPNPVAQPSQQAVNSNKAARIASGLCRFHFKYGDRAYSCAGNCAWQEN